MEKEFITVEEKSDTLNLIDGKIESYRENNQTKRTVRVYENGKIGVAGELGKAESENDKKELELRAERALDYGVPYVCNLSANVKKQESACAIEDDKFLLAAKRLAKKASAACPKFSVGGKIYKEVKKSSYKNTRGADLYYSGSLFGCSFLLKDRESSNIFDAGYSAYCDKYSPSFEAGIIADMRDLSDAYFTEPVKLADGEYAFVFDVWTIFNLILKDFIAEYYVAGGSLLSGKLGEKVFNAGLSVFADANPKTAYLCEFFDAEGEISPNFRSALIKNGVMSGVIDTKNSAAEYNLPLIKTAAAAYDGVPASGIKDIYVQPTAKDLTELFGDESGEKIIYVDTSSGGDITPDGIIGLPVQLAFLVEKGKISRRIKDFSVSANVFDILGKAFCGGLKKGVFRSDKSQKIVVRAKLINEN